MKTQDLSTMGAGFADLARDSQAVFRAALEALSHPGRLIDMPREAEVPERGHAASAVLLLALLDPDCRVWLSPTLASSDASAWLRFHCGCRVVDEIGEAHFAWVAASDEPPPLDRLAQGTEHYPDQSATCIFDVPSLADGAGDEGWTLRGPGIRDSVRLCVDGLPDAVAQKLLAERSAGQAAFPCGVDLFLATERQIVGLPRTTRIELEG
ncbi:MAG: phosphonate C-P lyase system protein PhnH [Gammaproteobacteria bacterium]|nr:phosphonate C-P lyase system protein PhnH [Gammaproteobacteria bacterium]MBU1442430.1 phosphonate C-P lyase system protein PhnH [Gammaproteobacteria bacterium]